MRGQSSFGRIGRALLAVVLGFFGVLTPMFTGTSSATLGPALQYTLDPGATITYVTPGPYIGAPITIGATEPLTGSFSVRNDPTRTDGSAFLSWDTLQLQTGSGHTIGIQGPGGEGQNSNGLWCTLAPRGCISDTFLTVHGIPGTSSFAAFPFQDTIGYDGSRFAPDGFQGNVTQRNYGYSGVGIYRPSAQNGDDYEPIAFLTFHATRVGPHDLPPFVTVEVPADGATYAQHRPLTTAYDCTDFSGVGTTSCVGPTPAGVALDTMTLGTHTFTVNEVDGNGATASATSTYTVVPDNDPPQVSVVQPDEGFVFSVGEQWKAAYNCWDFDGSGVTSCDGPIPDNTFLDTSSPGTYEFTVTGTDYAGNTATTTHHYTVIPLAPLLTFTPDAGATFTPVTPTVDGPVIAGTPEPVTGSYSMRLPAREPGPDVHNFQVAALHLETPSGVTFDSPGANGSQFYCVDTTRGCSAAVYGQASGLSATNTFLYSAALTPGQPRAEGSLASPSGMDWAAANDGVPPGVGLYTNTDDGALLLGIFSFHATRPGADLTPPILSFFAPPEGAEIGQGQGVAPGFQCIDNESSITSCAPTGDVHAGLLDTATLGAHTVTVTATNGEGNQTAVTHHYTVVPMPAPVTYYVDAGGTFTPTEPTSNAPVHAGTPEGLSGSFTLQYVPYSQITGWRQFNVTALHLQTASGIALDVNDPVSSRLYCSTTGFGCQPNIQVQITGSAVATQGILETTGLAIGTVASEGPANSPTGFNWSPGNTYAPPGIGLYSGSQIIGVVAYHASLNPPPPTDTTAPSITINTPADGAQYSLHQDVTSSFSCDDGSGSGVATCDGSVAAGAAIDTSTPGPHTFTVTTTDHAGNGASASTTYQVLAGDTSADVTGGEVVSTDPGGLGATPEVPVQTQIAVPDDVAGTISIASQPAGAAPPPGYVLFSKQLVLTGPEATSASSPYVVTFTIDASELGGTAPGDVAVFRNGALVGDCTDLSGAVPDPCVATRGTPSGDSGDAVVTVRTTLFSTWTLGARALSIMSVSPSSRGQGAAHQLIGITGAGFHAGATVSVEGTGVTVNAVGLLSSTAMLVDVSIDPAAPAGAARDVTVKNSATSSATCFSCFTVNAKPTVTSVSPNARPTGASHQIVTIGGTNFRTGATASFGAGITVNSVEVTDAAHLKVDLSVAANAAIGTRALTVKNSDGSSATLNAAFTVGALPTVSSVSPNSLRQGQTVSVAINGTNFLTNFGAGGGNVSFGTGITVNSITRNSATKLTASITAGATATAGARTVTVVNSDGGTATCANCLTVVALPRVISLAPASRPVGASHVAVTVTGTGFQSGITIKTSGTGITLNSLTRNSATSLTLDITVANNATIGARDVTVTNPDSGSTKCTGCFSVSAKPTVSGLNPGALARGVSHRTVAVNGTGFATGATVTFSGTGVTATVSAVTATRITLSVTVAANAATGNRNVTVTNPDGGTVTKASGFKVT